MMEEISCPYCGNPNPVEALFCQACSRVLDDSDNLRDQDRKTYLDQEQALVTETSAFLYGKTYPIAEIQDVEVIEKAKDRKSWGLYMILSGIGLIISGLFGSDFSSAIGCGIPLLLVGAIFYAASRNREEEFQYIVRISTEDGSENSLTLQAADEAEAILNAIQQACSDFRNSRGN